MSPAMWFLLGVSALAVVAWRRMGATPLTVSLVMWVVIAAVMVFNPLQLTEISQGAAWIIGIGLVATTVPGLLWPRRDVTPGEAEQGHRGVAFARLVIATAVVLAAVVVGVLAFRSGVSAATGADFSTLTPEQVRVAQTSSARGGGFAGLLNALNPLLGCLGVYGAIRYSRIWWVAVAIALAASLQTPARLTTLTLVVQVVVFYVYARQALPARPGKQRRRRPPRAALVIGGLTVLGLFNYLGDQVGKTSLVASYFPDFTWPAWSLSPILYFTGGPSALAYTLRSNIDPFQHPNSIYTLTRLWQALDPTYQAPDTLASFIPIGIPFNVYTGFGQIYFDFGIAGVVVMAAILGWFAVTAHAKATTGAMEWAWASSVLAGLLLSLPQAYRLFFLDTDFELALGFLAFWAIRRASLRTHGATVQEARRPTRPVIAPMNRRR